MRILRRPRLDGGPDGRERQRDGHLHLRRLWRSDDADRQLRQRVALHGRVAGQRRGETVV